MFSIPTYFTKYYDRSNWNGPYICILIGAIFIYFGLYGYLSKIRIEASSIQVSLVVLEMIESSGEKRHLYAPKFQIIEGTHKGKTYLGDFYSNPPIHDEGDKVDGWYNEETGLIESVEMRTVSKYFLLFFSMVGFGVVLGGFHWAAHRRIMSPNYRSM
ncbi:MAG: hypothetical protein GY750_03440 [Lentisphaerae bacterium]|nr:hypothetical protein [Lentisphaerota bacterium]